MDLTDTRLPSHLAGPTPTAPRLAALEGVADAARAYFVLGGSVARMVAVIDALRALDAPVGPPVTDPDRSPQHREAAGW